MNHPGGTFAPWLVVALIAAGAAINVLLLRPHNSLPCRGNAPLPLCSVQGPPVLQLELAWRDDDIVKILAPEPATLQRNIDDARAGNRIDTLLFVPTYALLLVALGGLAATRGRGFDRWFVAIASLAVVIAAADWAENYGITQALDHLQTGAVHSGDARAISNPALVKWFLLPVVLLLISVQLFKTLSLGPSALGLATLLLAAAIGYGLAQYARERFGDLRCPPERQAGVTVPPGCRTP